MMVMIDPKRSGPTRRSVVVSGSAFCLVSLAGCQLPGSGPAPRRIRLSPAEDFPPNLPAVAWSLQVQEPTTTLSVNTARIAIGKAGDIKYVAGGEWASRAPEMVMELVVESFRNSNKILAVGDRRDRIRADFNLQLRLSDFHIEKTADDAGTVRVRLDASLLKRPRRDPVATTSFDASADVSPLVLDDIVAAFDENLQDVMEQVVEWTLQTGANA
jgi:cholesterol transport system auxiliary component